MDPSAKRRTQNSTWCLAICDDEIPLEGAPAGHGAALSQSVAAILPRDGMIDMINFASDVPRHPTTGVSLLCDKPPSCDEALEPGQTIFSSPPTAPSFSSRDGGVAMGSV